MPKNSLVYGLPILVWVALPYGRRGRMGGALARGRAKSKKAVTAKRGTLNAPWSRLCF